MVNIKNTDQNLWMINIYKKKREPKFPNDKFTKSLRSKFVTYKLKKIQTRDKDLWKINIKNIEPIFVNDKYNKYKPKFMTAQLCCRLVS